MPFILDLFYLILLALLSPWLLWRALATGRYRRHLRQRCFGHLHLPNPLHQPVAWFHGVSLGEVQMLGVLINAFCHRHPDWLVVVSSTTDTGLAEARKRFPNLGVLPWPLDFSWAVANALDRIAPDVVILAESELWPNFLRAANHRNIPILVINGRISPRSQARLARLAPIVRPLLLDRVSHFAVQAQPYADRLRQLGVPAQRICVTGSIKYDGASGDRNAPRVWELRRLLGLNASNPERIWVAGSTHAPEEAIVIACYSRLKARFPDLRLILVPRHPDRFEEVARLLERSGLAFVRRSRLTAPLPTMPEVVLLDTVGELSAAWGLADVAFTGGSLDGHRGGQSMIEPAGYGTPTLFGPHVWNFRQPAQQLVDAGAARIIANATELENALAELLADDALRQRMGHAARELVRAQQGATERTLDVIDQSLGKASRRHAA